MTQGLKNGELCSLCCWSSIVCMTGTSSKRWKAV
jgi:hypothetical protein